MVERERIGQETVLEGGREHSPNAVSSRQVPVTDGMTRSVSGSGVEVDFSGMRPLPVALSAMFSFADCSGTAEGRSQLPGCLGGHLCSTIVHYMKIEGCPMVYYFRSTIDFNR